MSDNNYNRDACEAHFNNYNECKKFWGKVQMARKKSGISPALPPFSERAAIKKKYHETGSIPTEV